MKKDYLEDLKDELEEYPILKSDIYQILNNFERLYEEYMDQGLAPSTVEKKLGDPKEIVSNILASRKAKNRGLSPAVYFSFLVSLIIYLIVGYFTSLWHPTWLILLISPIVYVYKRK